ncbi:MAG: VPLPA-CTERM sorting domain-containing protein [Pseudomonadota bacterium]
MFGILRGLAFASALVIAPGIAGAIPLDLSALDTVAGGGGFNGGYATQITFDADAARGTANDRDNPLNALGPANNDFFEIGFGSAIALTFGTTFNTDVTVFEVTFGNPAGFPESADVFAGFGGDFTFIDNIPNIDAQGGAILALGDVGVFDTIVIFDTSNPADVGNAATGGFDVDAVRVTPVPLPAAGLMLVGAIGGLALMRRRRKAA